jgi:hypothetical protein
MLGFIIGFASLYGLVRVIRGGRGACGGGACGGGRWHGGGWGGHHRGGWGGHHSHGEHGGWGGGRDFWLRGISQRLDATPGQEKVIRQAVEDLKAAAQSGKGELDATRRDIASAVRSGAVDEVQLGELFARHDEKLREMRKTFVGSLAKVNEALDEDQRKKLAEILEGGFGRFGGGGPYRGGQWA